MSEDFFQHIASNEVVEDRFAWIDDELLRQNIAIYMRYIIFLLNCSEEKHIGTLKYSLYKNILIYTASIVEGILSYAIDKEIESGRSSAKILGKGIKYNSLAKVNDPKYTTDLEKLHIMKVTQYDKYGTKDRVDFKDLTHAAKKAGILDQQLYDRAEGLRNKRNTIHLSLLTESSDDYFDKEKVDEAFNCAGDVIKAVESLTLATT
jgi:hypothetical protein